MRKRVNNAEAGYSDLVLPRIIVTIVLIMSFIAIPNYFEYQARGKLVPVLDALQQGVADYYQKTQQLPDLENYQAIASQEFVAVHDQSLRINLSLLNKEFDDKYLQLKPYLEKEDVAWECTFVGDIYRNDTPVIRDGLCENSWLALEQRPLLERVWNFMQRIWGLLLGYVLFISVTFLVG